MKNFKFLRLLLEYAMGFLSALWMKSTENDAEKLTFSFYNLLMDSIYKKKNGESVFENQHCIDLSCKCNYQKWEYH